MDGYRKQISSQLGLPGDNHLEKRCLHREDPYELVGNERWAGLQMEEQSLFYKGQ